MERAKVIRGLRIAWTAFFGILCVLSIGLWVRSYWREDVLKAPNANLFLVTTFSGKICLTMYSVPIPPSQSGWAPGWGYLSTPEYSLSSESQHLPSWWFFSGNNGISLN